MTRRGLLFPFLMVAMFCAVCAHAAEIYSNGVGGGNWGEGATWRGGAVPGPTDDAVISQGDHIVFARDDSDAATCLNLFLDPKSSLVFKPRVGPVTLTVGETVEARGAVVMNAAARAEDVMTIRFISDNIERRSCKFLKGGSLVIYGASHGDNEAPNVRLLSHPINEKETDPTTRLDAEDGTGVDIRQARIENVAVWLSDIDNTGAEYNERVNIVGNQFDGWALLYLARCDTPLVKENRFTRDSVATLLQPAAIGFASCSLAEVRGNFVRGNYYYAINSWGCTDDSLTDNVVEGVYCGMHWYSVNTMIRNLTMRNVQSTVVMLNYMSGVIDGLVTENCKSAISVNNTVAQISNWKAEPWRGEGPKPVELATGRLVMLNCDIKPEQVNVPVTAKPHDPKEHGNKPFVQNMQFLVVGVKGEMPPGAMIEVETTNPNPPLGPGQSDMNVRNSPAPVLSNRLTPLPGTFQSLVVRSWSYDINRKFVDSPSYTLNVLGPADAEGNRPTLKSIPIQPTADWYRPMPDSPTATVEVTLP